MAFSDDIASVRARAEEQLDYIDTKEKTKNALVLPFIETLGYDIFDVREVEPEFYADVGKNRKKKVDYAIKRDGNPIMLVRCMTVTNDPSDGPSGRFFRHFTSVDAQIGVLTNGLLYQFFINTGESESINSTPFFVFHLLEYKDKHLSFLEKITKWSSEFSDIPSIASEIRYRDMIKQYLLRQIDNPDQEFVKFFLDKFYDNDTRQDVIMDFRDIIKDVMNDIHQSNFNDDRNNNSDRRVNSSKDIVNVIDRLTD